MKVKIPVVVSTEFISPILDLYDNSPNQWLHPSVCFPLRGNKYHKVYKSYFISKVKEKKIKTIYEIREGEKIITELILNEECYSKEKVSKMLLRVNLKLNCTEFK